LRKLSLNLIYATFLTVWVITVIFHVKVVACVLIDCIGDPLVRRNSCKKIKI
jgi:hypothetical protein